jgi:[acyl-carrier-protein] S-malonyltransferase
MTPGTVLLCPGQGAQAIGMGVKWRGTSSTAAEVFSAADQIVGSRFDKSLSELCSDGPDTLLNRTDVAQPAIYVAGVACARALFGNAGPADLVATAGLSLGEYTALHLAGVFTFEEGLELVLLRGRAMQDAAEAVPSGMVALVGADEAQASAVCEKAAQGDVLVPANFNAPGQVVVSGGLAACDRAVTVASEMGLRATKLAVAGAFHSPIMRPAAERLAAKLEVTPMLPPRCTVVSNVTGQAHTTDPASIRARLVEQLTQPVRWSEGCTWLAANFSGPYRELAPGRVLSGLFRRIDRNVKVESHDEPA